MAAFQGHNRTAYSEVNMISCNLFAMQFMSKAKGLTKFSLRVNKTSNITIPRK